MRRLSRKLAAPPLALALVTASLVGCASAPSIYTVRRGIEEQVPQAHFEKETQIRLGRISLGLAKKIFALVADEEEERSPEMAFIRSLKKVEVGVYQVRLSSTEEERLALPRHFERALARGGWETLIRARDGGDQTWIFLRPDGDMLRSLYVVTYDGGELVLVHIEGRMDLLLEELAKENPEGLADLFVEEFS